MDTPTPMTYERIAYTHNTYKIISKVAYLIGIPKRIFENEIEPPKIEIFESLEKDKSARIIRHLCILRTAIQRNYKTINFRMHTDICGLMTLPDLIPKESIQQLTADGVNFKKTPTPSSFF